MSAHRIIVRKSPGWQAFDACTLGVSIMNPNWQGEYFGSILDFAAANFRTIRIDVTDALYRHNFMAQGLSRSDAEASAAELGASWISRHNSIIGASPVTPDVIRWAHWYGHPDYQNVFDDFQAAAATCRVFRDAIDKDVDAFFRRQGRDPTVTERQYSRDFLVEEVAVITLQAREQPGLRIYPGNELLCLNVVRGGLVPAAPRGLEREQFAKVSFHVRRVQPVQGLSSHAPPLGFANRSVSSPAPSG